MKKIIRGISALLVMVLTVSTLAFTSFANEELNQNILEKSREEVECEFEIKMKEIEESYITGIETRGPKYEYKTTYGASKYTTVKGYAGNQPRGGNKFGTGGAFYHSDSGGPSVSASVSFGSPYGSLGISIPIGNNAKTGYIVNVPDNKYYYKLYIEKKVEVKPYITYRRVKGTSRWNVYVKGTVPVVYRVNRYAKRV